MNNSQVMHLLEQHRVQLSDKIAVQDRRQSVTYRQLFLAADNMAAYLLSQGMQGERIVFWTENCWELLCLYVACFKVGAVAVPMKYVFPASKVQSILHMTNAKIFVVDASKMTELSQINLKDTSVEKTIVVGGDQAAYEQDHFDRIVAESTPHSFASVSEETPAFIIFTSGTTGEPKGVVQSHRALAYIMSVVANQLMQVTTGSINLVSYSINQISGIAQQALPMLMCGGTVILLDPLNVDQLITGLAQYPVTNLHLTPYMLGKLLHHSQFKKSLFQHLKCFISGADKVPIELQNEFFKVTGKHITEGYGATETFISAANFNASADDVGTISPLRHVEMKVMVNENQEAGIKELGELWVKSPGLMLGYWQDPKATNQVIKNGWYLTGDLAKKDEQNRFWMMGRKKQIIIRRGSNISPLQVEAAFYKHPAVKFVGVVGVPKQGEGEVPRAFVELKAGLQNNPSEAELQTFVCQFLSDYEVPDQVVFVGQIPKTAAGKVDRGKLNLKTAAG